MNRVVVATAIPGNEESREYMNSLVSMEIKRQQARMRAAKELERTKEESRKRRQDEKIMAMKCRYSRRINPLERIIDAIDTAWCMAWGIWRFRKEIFIEWCIRKGFLVKEN